MGKQLKPKLKLFLQNAKKKLVFQFRCDGEFAGCFLCPAAHGNLLIWRVTTRRDENLPPLETERGEGRRHGPRTQIGYYTVVTPIGWSFELFLRLGSAGHTCRHRRAPGSWILSCWAFFVKKLLWGGKKKRIVSYRLATSCISYPCWILNLKNRWGFIFRFFSPFFGLVTS